MPNAVDDATRGIERVASSARETIGAAAGEASQSIRQAAESQRQRGADAMECLANAVRAAAHELGGTSPAVGHYVDEAAGGLVRASRAMREQTTPELLRRTADLARQQPAMAFAGAVLAGIAMSRFIKSSAGRAGESGNGERGSTKPGASVSGDNARGASSVEARPDLRRENDRAPGGGTSSVEAHMSGGLDVGRGTSARTEAS